MESPVRDQSATCPQSSQTLSGTETDRSLLTVAIYTGSLPGPQTDHATFEPSLYYSKLPPLEGRATLLLDPMLATGASASAACDALEKAGAKQITLLSVVSAPEGVQRLQRLHPGVDIVTASIDDGLNEYAYIVPGLGDFGDRLFGTL